MTMVRDTVTVLDGQSTPAQYQATVYRDTTTQEKATAVRELPGDIDSSWWNYPAAAGGILNTTTAVTIKAAAAAGLRNYITALQIDAEALTNATELVIRDGPGGTVLFRMKIGTPGLLNGRNIVFSTPLKGSAATLLEVATLTASGAGAVYVNAQGFIAP